MKKRIQLLDLLVTSSLLLGTSACQSFRDNYPNVTTVKSVPVSVTTLEIQPVAVTTLEVESQPSTTQLEVESQPASTTVKVESTPVTPTKIEVQPTTKTTAATVARTLTELKAQKTSEGIRINLPENILFDFDQYQVRSAAKPTLTKINQLLRYYSKAPVFIYGYTDNKGSDTYNQMLSQKRAAAVKYYLVNNFKIVPTRLQTKGFGKTKPVALNNNPNGSDNPAGRQKNRRVEVIIKN